jgi:kinesin family protein 3/17/kinesin family protein 4/21/27/kinesin family protein 5
MVKLEMCEMQDIINKQQRVIEKIESGAYSAGIKSFNIPSKDKPQLPSRTKFSKYVVSG